MFGRPLNRSNRGRLRAAVVWAMVPLAFWTARPISGCICADGHYEPSCTARFCRSSETAANHKPEGASRCGCSCCAAGGSGHVVRACCLAKTQHHKQTSMRSENGCEHHGIAGSKCCKGVIQTQVMPPRSSPPSIDDDHRSLAFSPSGLLSTSADSPSIAPCRVDEDTGPPPVDLVVTLQRLVI